MVESTPLLPKHSSQFQSQQFWADFFKESQKQESFEWYSEYAELLPYLKAMLPEPTAETRLLIPGCGDSLLSEKLALEMGYKNVVSIDFEPEVIARMQKRGVAGLTYETMDILDLKYESGSFQAIVDKGTYDAICVDYKEETVSKLSKYLQESMRVLN